ncbi:hypothetical protein ACFYOV_17565 [Streptomyces sp. NPDC005931]|uniref:hypothetical protein n=1 Tax=Streptomyces sp. NPDC005931 TaxID=3364737 RepID=UPI0036B74B93
MSQENPTRDLPLSDGSPVRTVTAMSDMALTDEELLRRYPTVRGVAERWMALAWELGTDAERRSRT